MADCLSSGAVRLALQRDVGACSGDDAVPRVIPGEGVVACSETCHDLKADLSHVFMLPKRERDDGEGPGCGIVIQPVNNRG